MAHCWKTTIKSFRNDQNIEGLIDYLERGDFGESLLYGTQQARQGSSADRIHHTQFELLTQLTDSCNEALPRVETEYIAMTRKCNSLLLQIRQQLKVRFGFEHEKNGVEFAEGAPKWNLVMVYRVLQSASGGEMGMGMGGTNISVRWLMTAGLLAYRRWRRD
jgi:hypothetical protein